MPTAATLSLISYAILAFSKLAACFEVSLLAADLFVVLLNPPLSPFLPFSVRLAAPVPAPAMPVFCLDNLTAVLFRFALPTSLLVAET